MTKTLLRRCAKLCRDTYDYPTFEKGPVSGSLQVFEDAQYICFTGSENLFNWLSNLYFLKVARGYFKGKAHKGFVGCFEGIRAHAVERLEKDKPVIVTGHSLGGAMAVLMVYYLKYIGYDVKACVTFGKPRVGNVAFRDGYHELGVETTRVVFERDMVPTTPKIGFNHEGVSLVISGTEVSSYDAARGVMHFIKDPLGFATDHSSKGYYRCIVRLNWKEINGTQADSNPVETP